MRLKAALAIAAISGFVALSYEIVWYRVLAFMTRGVASSFGLLLGAYLFGLAIGSRASTVFCRDSRERVPALRPLALFVAIANVVGALVVPTFAWSAKFTDYRIGLAMVAIGAALLGSVLPLSSHYGIEPDERAGARLSYVYLANIIGSAAGSLVTGFVLMDRLKLITIATLLIVAGFGLVALLVAMGGFAKRSAIAAYAALAIASAAAFVVTPRLYDRVYERLLYKREYDGSQRFAQVIENKSGVITVTGDGTVYGGGAYDGVVSTSIKKDLNGIVRAYAIGAMHPAPRNVLMIGLASGSWAQVVAHLPGVEHLTVVEINPGYAELIRQHSEVRGVLENPKVTLVIDDGRRWLLRNPERRFDVIVMNTTWHWRAHVSSLLSVEFMELARAHLSSGGLFYFNTTKSFDVQQTAARTFPNLVRIANFVAVSDSPFRFDRDRWRALLRDMRIEGRPAFDFQSEEDVELYERIGAFNDIELRDTILEGTKLASLVTDDNMIIEWREPLRYPE